MTIKQCLHGRLALAAVPFALCLMAACGVGPTGNDSDTSAFKEAKTETGKQLDDIYAELDGLSPAARKEKLIALAEDESGPLIWYTAAADDDNAELMKRFKKDTGIDVRVYRASSATVLNRALEEAKTGEIGGDVLNLSGLDPTTGSRKGLYAKLETPIASEMEDGTVHEDWIADQFYPFIFAWNKKLVNDPPQDFEKLLTSFNDGELGFEATDSVWLYGIVAMLQETKGMAEDEAVDMVAEAARKGVPVVGHTLLSETLAAGRYAAATSTYHYRTARQVEQGAPVEWQPQPNPIPTTVSGSAISATTSRPASALLFVEFQLTGEQEYWAEAGRTPTNTNYNGGIRDGKTDYELFIIDGDAMYDNLGKWNKLYQKMMESSGREVKE